MTALRALERASQGWRVSLLRHEDELLRGAAPGVDLLCLPAEEAAGAAAGRYLVGFAASQRAVEAALRLRFEVFNVELREGLAESWRTGLDRDPFDAAMAHLVLIERASGALAGTYRLQTEAMARASGLGFYSAQEYDLTGMSSWLPHATELGRACVGREHRSLAAVMALWQGIRGFLRVSGQRYVFGCCSLTTQDPDDGWRALRTIRAQGALHSQLWLPATRAYSCGDPARADDPALGALALPKLFRTYLRLGTQVVSEPALDRDFGTVDFLVLQDRLRVNLSALGGDA